MARSHFRGDRLLGASVTIPGRVLDAVRAHAREEQPRECCGVLLGTGGRILDSLRARNLADDPDRRFLLDPVDHIAARRTARARRLEVVGFYHSHPRSEALPSATDHAEASYPEAVSLIVGVDGRARLFRLASSGSEELVLEIVDP